MRCIIALFLAISSIGNGYSQNVGVATLVPDHKLHVVSNDSALLKLDNTLALANNVSNNLVFKTGTYYTGAIRTIGASSAVARLAFFTYAGAQPSALKERLSILDDGKVGIGTSTPTLLLDVAGRVRLRSSVGNITAGIYFSNSLNSTNPAFVGMLNDTTMGFYGSDAGWDFLMNTNTGNIGVGIVPSTMDGFGFSTKFTLKTPVSIGGSFESTYPGGIGLYSLCETEDGTGLWAHGGTIGVKANALKPGTGTVHKGLEAYGQQATDNNYGVYANGATGKAAYGIYATAFSGTISNWAGYFAGSVYSSGTYQGSDRKLKRNIQPLTGALSLIEKLQPSAYNYKTIEFKQMQLPDGLQYGLIADEVQAVIPGLVKTGMQPAVYENETGEGGKKLSEAIEFGAVNYTALIPVLIAAIKEQQVIINSQQQRLAMLEAAVKSK